MQIVWRTLPKLALPAAIGLGIAYLATSFVPRPAPNLRPPEELRAQGQAYGEESPVRIILERNVLKLESSPFFPLGQPPAPIVAPEEPPSARPPAPAQAAFAQADTSLTPEGAMPATSAQATAAPQVSATAPLSGGSSVQGLAVQPAAPGSTATPAAPAAPSQPVSSPSAQAPSAPGKSAALPAPPAAAKAPPVAASAAKSQPAAPASPRLGLEGFRLVGVIAGGERPLAMLQVDGASVSLHIGEAARGWTLVSVEPGQVLLQNGAEQRRVMLGAAGPAQRAKAP
ncbi:MAG: hypothetical protein KKF77_07040 [Proteobacteria bacterium]|nr:hypothetical protein [Pseudomonadota bacterium]